MSLWNKFARFWNGMTVDDRKLFLVAGATKLAAAQKFESNGRQRVRYSLRQAAFKWITERHGPEPRRKRRLMAIRRAANQWRECAA